MELLIQKQYPNMELMIFFLVVALLLENEMLFKEIISCSNLNIEVFSLRRMKNLSEKQVTPYTLKQDTHFS